MKNQIPRRLLSQESEAFDGESFSPYPGHPRAISSVRGSLRSSTQAPRWHTLWNWPFGNALGIFPKSVRRGLLCSVVCSVLSGLVGLGCQSSSDEKIKNPPPPVQKIFFSPYDQVWRAAQLSLRYPVQLNNQETGVLETEWIREPEGFSIPGSERKPSMGVRYKIRMLFVRGEIDSKNSTRVTVVKRAERIPDFFSDPKPIYFPDLEEQVILYRIERELQIEEGIRKANRLEQEKNQTPPEDEGSKKKNGTVKNKSDPDGNRSSRSRR